MKDKLIEKLSYLLALILTICFSACTNIDGLISQGKLLEAEEYCKNQDESNRVLCYSKLAESYLQNNNYDKAAVFYINAGESDIAVYNKIADDAFTNNKYEKAAEYYNKAGNTDGQKKVAEMYFNNNNYDKAAVFYINAGESDIAVYNKIADDAFINNKYEKAAEYYDKAGNTDGQKKVASKIAYLKKLEAIKIGTYSGDGIKINVTKDYEIQVTKITMYFDDDTGISEDSFKSVPMDESFNFSCYQKNIGHGYVTRGYHADVGAYGTTIHFSYAEQWDIKIEGNINGQIITGKITIFEKGKILKVANWKAK